MPKRTRRDGSGQQHDAARGRIEALRDHLHRTVNAGERKSPKKCRRKTRNVKRRELYCSPRHTKW
jgi:hypothetical protein